MPTPAWAAAVFILLGLALSGGGAAGFYFSLIHPSPNPVGVALTGAVTAMGLLAIVHGARALLMPGRV